MSAINSQTLKGIVLPTPPISEQKIIAKTHTRISDLIEKKSNYLEHCQNLKKALMQDLLTGKVRVKVN